MPELTVIHIGIATGAVLLGIVIGWLIRGKRSTQEKAAISAGWQEQIEAQRTEHGRLADQNKSLMEQVNQFQASHKDSGNRARELSDALKEAFAKRDELQREIKDVRNNLESALAERKRLQSSMASRPDPASTEAAVQAKDEKISRLNKELKNWQGRLPPLIERFRERDADANRLESELASANRRIEDLESRLRFDQTMVEPAETEPDELDASNETIIGTVIESIADPVPEEQVPASSNGKDQSGEFPDEPQTLRDDLQQIKGVGPAIEKTLNELGIFRFGQIASMSEYDIDRIAKRLKGFRTRIYREDWIGQARELDDQRASGL